MSDTFDFDYIIIGSGFGGSVSAMRLSQKGYRVAVIESGKRWKTEDFPKTNWNIRKFLWFPKIFCYGIQRINLLSHVMILSGAGVGGGSLVYANTLYVPLQKFFEVPVVKKMGGLPGMSPFFDLAKRMLGVIENPKLWDVDHLMKRTAEEFGVGDSFRPTDVGIYFGKTGVASKDPYSMGEGPERIVCNFCGGCMVGCRFHAKNTLDKNYLYFAEKLGAVIIPETKVTEIVPLSDDGSEGYEIRTESTTGLFGFPRKSFRSKGVVLSAGVLGTVNLLTRMKESGRLPNLSERLGHMVRTNSESIVGVTVRHRNVDFSRGIAITSSVHPDAETHIEPVRYSPGSDVMGTLATIMTDGGGKVPRQLKFLYNVVRHPLDFARTVLPFGFAKRSIILLVMQTLDNSIHLVRKRRWIWPFQKSLTSARGPEGSDHPPSYIPVANEFSRKLAAKIHGVPRSAYNEVLLDVPTTAHILGGCCIGQTPEEGVIDMQNRVFGYENMLVCDGSMIPGNLGVNPSLSITAFSERAMSYVAPALHMKVQSSYTFEKKWSVTGVIQGEKSIPSPSARQIGTKKAAGKKQPVRR